MIFPGTAGPLAPTRPLVTYVLSPQRIVLGGGVMRLAGLIDAVRARTVERLAGALAGTPVTGDIERYLVPPALGGSSGVLGAIALAELVS